MEYASPSKQPCKTCGGTGKVQVPVQGQDGAKSGEKQTEIRTCPECKGAKTSDGIVRK